jgi:pyridoxine 4-dehydrogenase
MHRTWAWGNQLLWGYSQEDDRELQQTFDFVTSKGVNWFDTADSYGTGKLTGQSEKLLGEFLSKQTKTQSKSVSFCTKIAPFPWRVGKQSMLDSFEKSKDRMQGPVDMVQLHWPPVAGWQQDAYLDAFSEIIDAGDAGQIGTTSLRCV